MSQTIASAAPISPLRRRMIEDMTVRGFGEKTQSDYIRHVKNFSTFLGRSPDTAEGKDLRAFQALMKPVYASVEQQVGKEFMDRLTAAAQAAR